MKKWLFILHQHTKQLWFRSSLYCLLAVFTALLGTAVNDRVPEVLLGYVDSRAVQKILEILASSMLIVATFALSVTVQAYRAATITATPRATQLLTENTSAQNALAAFVGAFLFSIVGLIALSANIYSEGGAAVLFASTVLVLIVVVLMLLRWIEQLSRLGRVEESINLVESATRKALVKRARMPYLGGRALQEIPPDQHPVYCDTIGYVQYIDMMKLQELAASHHLQIYLDILPGSFCDLAEHIAYTSNAVDEAIVAAICEALVIGDSRTFPQDPRFGLIVLTEIAQRALSPSTNDPGTAIDVVGTSVRLFHYWAKERPRNLDHTTIHYDRVWARALQEADLFEDVFAAISYAGAGHREVCIRLQKALRAISRFNFPPYQQPARRWSDAVLSQARDHLNDADIERIKTIMDSFNKPPVAVDNSP